MLKRWEQYCIRYWMSGDGKPGSPEQRIKRFLDDCAYLLLRDEPGDTLSRYKEIMHGRAEFDVSSCPSWVSDLMYASGCLINDLADEEERFQRLMDAKDEIAKPYKSKPKDAEEDKTNDEAQGRKKKKRRETRFTRFEKLKREFPNCEIVECIVDTDNVFKLGNHAYRIHADVECYAPKQTQEGLIYDMDRIFAVIVDGEPVCFVSQNAERLYDKDVYKCCD